MTEVKPHVKVVQHPNPTRRSYHVTREVVEGENKFGFGESAYSSSLSFFKKNKPGDLVKLIQERLQAIPGVIGGHFENYEISVAIGEAFDWSDIGPVVLGEIVNALFPETLGNTIEVSARVGWSYHAKPSSWDMDDDGHRVRYEDTVRREVVEVKDPQVLDVERFLNAEAVQQVQQKVAAEPVVESPE